MKNEPKPGLGFVPSRGRIDPVPSPASASIVNNYYFYVSPEALQPLKEAIVWAVVLAVLVLIGYMLFR